MWNPSMFFLRDPETTKDPMNFFEPATPLTGGSWRVWRQESGRVGHFACAETPERTAVLLRCFQASAEGLEVGTFDNAPGAHRLVSWPPKTDPATLSRSISLRFCAGCCLHLFMQRAEHAWGEKRWCKYFHTWFLFGSMQWSKSQTNLQGSAPRTAVLVPDVSRSP